MSRIADEPTIYPVQNDLEGALAQWIDRVHVAEEWQYLVVKSGGVALKSDMDAMLMERFLIGAIDARRISNQVTSGLPNERMPWKFVDGIGVVWQADRPEPEEAQS